LKMRERCIFALLPVPMFHYPKSTFKFNFKLNLQ
jgi:hypothetical protein